MRVVVQRVKWGRVLVADAVVGEIGAGLLLLVGVAPTDGPVAVEYLADKILNLRIFADDAGKMNRSVTDVGGGLLVVSQFTLYGDCRKGRRPSFIEAAHPDHAKPLYETLLKRLAAGGLKVQAGIFGADMLVESANDGPVT
ncbi:MAG: D-aminoacyl-tRNA deacylase, partial [Planctomycetia bacterium]